VALGRRDEFEDALSCLPLFPLPEVILLPGVLLPLHVFEPRYRKMVRDVLESHNCIAVVQILEGAPVDSDGHPRIAAIAGVGSIVDSAELPNGRFNIVLRGRARVELQELPFVPPYRRAKCRVLPSVEDDLAPHVIPALLAAVSSFVANVQRRDPSFEFRVPRGVSEEVVINHCAQQLLIEGRDRQKILETARLSERAELLTEFIALQQMSLGMAGGVLN
jgi:Lon protease-like protein